MLYTHDRKKIEEVPYQNDYKIWRGRLTEDEYAQLVDVLTEKISGDSIVTSSWIPGSDWTDTPYHIIYEKACRENEMHAAMFFGLILWDAVMRHPDTWCFGKYNQKNGVEGTTYFRISLE